MASSLRTDEEFVEIYNRHVDTVYRVCFFHEKCGRYGRYGAGDFSEADLLQKKFTSKEHEKAWLIVTASNTCKDELRRFRRRLQYISDCLKPESGEQTGEEGISELIGSLPPKYKEVVYLHYYEVYQISEIAGMLHCPASTVRSRLSRARKLLQRDVV